MNATPGETSMRQLADQVLARHGEIPDGFEAALRLGALVVCSRCRLFDPATPGPGHCRRYGVEAWGNAPFQCAGYEAAACA